MRNGLVLGFFTLACFASSLASVGCSGSDTITGTGSSPPNGSGAGARDDANDDPKSPPAVTSDGGTNVPPPDPDAPPSTPPPTSSGSDGLIAVPQAIGTTASGDFVLSQAKKTRRFSAADDGMCPISFLTGNAPAVFVELKNTGTKRALTSVWTSDLANGPANTADTIAVYAGSTPPVTDQELSACLGRADFYCIVSPCVSGPGYSSNAGDAVEIAAGASTIIMVQGAPAKTGSFKLNVRTELLQ